VAGSATELRHEGGLCVDLQADSALSTVDWEATVGVYMDGLALVWRVTEKVILPSVFAGDRMLEVEVLY
jgi:hypothetical protein